MDFPKNNLGGWIVPDGTSIPALTTIPAYSTLGNTCTLGDTCKIGNTCKLEGIAARRWMTCANVDGSGRQILIVWDGKQAVVRAGCFRGSPEAFAAKATEEGKHTYSRVILAIVAALIEEKVDD